MEKVQRQAGPSKLIHALAATLLALACAAAVDCPRIGALNAAQVLGAVAHDAPDRAQELSSDPAAPGP